MFRDTVFSIAISLLQNAMDDQFQFEFFFASLLRIIPWKYEQPLLGMVLQEKDEKHVGKLFRKSPEIKEILA